MWQEQNQLALEPNASPATSHFLVHRTRSVSRLAIRLVLTRQLVGQGIDQFKAALFPQYVCTKSQARVYALSAL
jgi:hypothetical protein